MEKRKRICIDKYEQGLMVRVVYETRKRLLAADESAEDV